MKKALIILAVLTLFAMISGGLYTTLAKLDSVEDEVNEYALMNPFPLRASLGTLRVGTIKMLVIFFLTSINHPLMLTIPLDK